MKFVKIILLLALIGFGLVFWFLFRSYHQRRLYLSQIKEQAKKIVHLAPSPSIKLKTASPSEKNLSTEDKKIIDQTQVDLSGIDKELKNLDAELNQL